VAGDDARVVGIEPFSPQVWRFSASIPVFDVRIYDRDFRCELLWHIEVSNGTAVTPAP
jgi:hypothetical protein